MDMEILPLRILWDRTQVLTVDQQHTGGTTGWVLSQTQNHGSQTGSEDGSEFRGLPAKLRQPELKGYQAGEESSTDSMQYSIGRKCIRKRQSWWLKECTHTYSQFWRHGLPVTVEEYQAEPFLIQALWACSNSSMLALEAPSLREYGTAWAQTGSWQPFYIPYSCHCLIDVEKANECHIGFRNTSLLPCVYALLNQYSAVFTCISSEWRQLKVTTVKPAAEMTQIRRQRSKSNASSAIRQEAIVEALIILIGFI